MWDAQVLLHDLSPKGKIGLTIKAKQNQLLKIQGIHLAILAFFVNDSEFFLICRHSLDKTPQLLLKQLAWKLKN